MDKPALRRLLLAMAGTATPPDAATLARLDQAQWLALDGMAALHRLQPQLHLAWRDSDAVPADLRRIWRAAHRESAMIALAQRADLIDVTAMLRGGGIEPLALKGSWLGWHAYPAPALRPMRDIDLLVREADYAPAMRLLAGAGLELSEGYEVSLDEMLAHGKIVAPFVAPRGTLIELHKHAWQPEERLEYPGPTADDAGLFARSRLEDDGIRYPGGEDMLAHLVIHAVYGHRLDCGPLLLSDIDWLLRRETIDWPGFWARAEAEGWRRGARLVFELVRYWRPQAPVDFAADPGAPLPAELVDASADLMLQELDTRQSAGFIAAALAGGPATLLRRLRARDKRGAGEGVERLAVQRSGGYLGWAVSRLRRTAGDLLRRETRAQARDMTRFTRWLAE